MIGQSNSYIHQNIHKRYGRGGVEFRELVWQVYVRGEESILDVKCIKRPIMTRPLIADFEYKTCCGRALADTGGSYKDISLSVLRSMLYVR